MTPKRQEFINYLDNLITGVHTECSRTKDHTQIHESSQFLLELLKIQDDLQKFNAKFP